MHEAPFAFGVGATTVAGSIDLLSWRGADALAVDYKTGATPTTPQVLARWRRQAECYALAVLKAGASNVRVSFVKLEAGCEAHTFELSATDMPKLETEIVSVLEQIAAGRFVPLARYSPLACPDCPALGNLCPVRAPRRRDGAA